MDSVTLNWQVVILALSVFGAIMMFILRYFYDAINELKKQNNKIERDFLEFKSRLPYDYVFRDDSVRSQSVIEMKLDGIGKSLRDIYLGGRNNGQS